MQFNTTATYVIPSNGTTYYSPTSNLCYWNFQKVGNGTEFIIGEQFYAQYYTVFDNENLRMGFGIGISATTNVTIENAPIPDPEPTPTPDPTPEPVPSKNTQILLIGGLGGASVAVIGLVAYLIFKGATSAASAAAAPAPKSSGPKSAWTMNTNNNLAWKGRVRINTTKKSSINTDLI